MLAGFLLMHNLGGVEMSATNELLTALDFIRQKGGALPTYAGSSPPTHRS